MSNRVRGPFIEYECTNCGHKVQCNANPKTVREDIARMSQGQPLLCAGCCCAECPTVLIPAEKAYPA